MNEGKNRFFYAKRHTLRTVNAPATLSAVAVACGMRFINDIVNSCEKYADVAYGTIGFKFCRSYAIYG